MDRTPKIVDFSEERFEVVVCNHDQQRNVGISCRDKQLCRVFNEVNREVCLRQGAHDLASIGISGSDTAHTNSGAYLRRRGQRK